MTSIWHFEGLGGVEVTPPRAPIRVAPAPPVLPPARPEGAHGYLRSHARDELNGRVVSSLPRDAREGSYEERWGADIHPRFPPPYVLWAGDRIVVQATEHRIFDRDGALVASGRTGGGPVVLDPDRGLFYRFIPGSFFAAARLSDGEQAYLVNPSMGDMYSRPVLARRGDRLIFVGVERALDPHGHHVPSTSRIEALDLGSAPRVDELGLLVAQRHFGDLVLPTTRTIAAAGRDELVCATGGCLYRIAGDLQIRAAHEAEIDPVTMSLDEAGRAYLVARTAVGPALWLVSPEGERLYELLLPKTAAAPIAPPLVAHDHTAYLFLGDHVYAVRPEGTIAWDRRAPGLVGGIVTGDDRLVTTEGSAVATYDSVGERLLLGEVSGGPILTPPALTDRGEILCAKGARLVCLAP